MPPITALPKLGRLRPNRDQRARALPLKAFMPTAALPQPPTICENSLGAALGMWGNDKYGCCTVAALANMRAIDAHRAREPAPATTEGGVVSSYFKLTGGADNGLVEHDVLDAAMKGLELGGDTWMAAAWVTVGLDDLDLCKTLVAMFGSLYLAVELPTDAQKQLQANGVWEPTTGTGGAPGSWGGHALLLTDFDPSGFGLVTWGGVQRASVAWLAEYAVEAHLVLDADDAGRLGVDWDRLVTAMNEVRR